MKSQIADELMRDDLTSNIALAITEAIEFHQKKRYYFNEADSVTFLDGGKYEYTSSDNANIPNLFQDAGGGRDGGEPELRDCGNHAGDGGFRNGSTSGQPYNYTYFNRTIRLFPTPNDADGQGAGPDKKAEPASDSRNR